MRVFVLIFFLSVCTAQNWFVQRHYPAPPCSGVPYLEAAGSGPACASAPCSLTFSSPNDYTTTLCTGRSPSISISPAMTVTGYASSDCSGATSVVTAASTSTCTALASGSVRFVCTSSGITKMQFVDTTCSTFASNSSLASGTPNACSRVGLGSQKITCSGASLAIVQAIVILLLLAVV